MFERLIETAVEKALDRRTVRPDKKLTLEGYHPLSEIMGALYEWLLIPFRGTEILVEVRYPRSTQLPDVDKLYSVIENLKKGKKPIRQEIIDVMNIQEMCCEAVLNRPTLKEIKDAIYGKDNVFANNKKEFEEFDEKLKSVKNDASRRELQLERDRLELFCGYILPDDTMVTLTNIALGVDVSDIKKLTEEKLIIAYNKARLYSGKPSDFVSGLFTDGDRQNIDDYATWLGSTEEANRIRDRGKNVS